ncbi:hypothetical protein B0H10DRAFT_2199451 [Mycena sp. CBHHK59/15]|nr:hypothetical protein B0H10DRAFT_2199451 [Mycena sp. CBHHK59/15]
MPICSGNIPFAQYPAERTTLPEHELTCIQFNTHAGTQSQPESGGTHAKEGARGAGGKGSGSLRGLACMYIPGPLELVTANFHTCLEKLKPDRSVISHRIQHDKHRMSFKAHSLRATEAAQVVGELGFDSPRPNVRGFEFFFFPSRGLSNETLTPA